MCVTDDCHCSCTCCLTSRDNRAPSQRSPYFHEGECQWCVYRDAQECNSRTCASERYPAGTEPTLECSTRAVHQIVSHPSAAVKYFRPGFTGPRLTHLSLRRSPPTDAYSAKRAAPAGNHWHERSSYPHRDRRSRRCQDEDDEFRRWQTPRVNLIRI